MIVRVVYVGCDVGIMENRRPDMLIYVRWRFLLGAYESGNR